MNNSSRSIISSCKSDAEYPIEHWWSIRTSFQIFWRRFYPLSKILVYLKEVNSGYHFIIHIETERGVKNDFVGRKNIFVDRDLIQSGYS